MMIKERSQRRICLFVLSIFGNAILVFLLWLPENVWASCWIPSLTKDPLGFVIKKSDVIFVAVADSVIKKTMRSANTEESLLEISSAFNVDMVLKGELKSGVSVNGSASINCQCVYDFEPGVKYLVLASLKEGKYFLHWCNYIRPVTDNDSLLEDVKSKIKGGNKS